MNEQYLKDVAQLVNGNGHSVEDQAQALLRVTGLVLHQPDELAELKKALELAVAVQPKRRSR